MVIFDLSHTKKKRAARPAFFCYHLKFTFFLQKLD